MSKRRPYRRPIAANWWAKPPYRAYTTRELSGVAVSIYGGVLFAGLVSLFRGPESYETYLRFLASPLSLGLHVLLLAAVLFHVVTWFQTLPKTMPHVVVGGEPVAARTITRIATLAAAATSLALILFTLWVSR
ncbi:fumarate reductase subunit C [Rhodoblastus sphagnicola]|uniref:Fumarate reductase subunit C n=1 Tax=Rhodoblastus sphagnicola TaxID=333368 RepID=A0A2S6NBA6_9HYPH|nr:fumarate reductase subunit C [Rhodoblastus sphagnicola]MBB4197743.1 fumarate reductase subunit C [Rhodoblastus sphagnicola]PPQ31887.1 fumarate reductase subunit C [Rhodoblastus sphagnicola]